SDRELDLSAMLSRSAVSRARSGLATATSNRGYGDATGQHRATLSMLEPPLHTATRPGIGHRPAAGGRGGPRAPRRPPARNGPPGVAPTRRVTRYSRVPARTAGREPERCLARRGPGTTATACLRRRHTFAPVRRERLRCAFFLGPRPYSPALPA